MLSKSLAAREEVLQNSDNLKLVTACEQSMSYRFQILFAGFVSQTNIKICSLVYIIWNVKILYRFWNCNQSKGEGNTWKEIYFPPHPSETAFVKINDLHTADPVVNP